MEKQIENLYIKTYGTAPTEIERLSAAGSNRTYFRMKRDGESVVGCVGTSTVENRTFVYMARHFEKLELPVPRVIAISDDQMCYLQEDLGAESLYELIAEGRKAGGKYSDVEIDKAIDGWVKALGK
jgi:aminoglycoside/choline kinase family phosphotransferase